MIVMKSCEGENIVAAYKEVYNKLEDLGHKLKPQTETDGTDYDYIPITVYGQTIPSTKIHHQMGSRVYVTQKRSDR